MLVLLAGVGFVYQQLSDTEPTVNSLDQDTITEDTIKEDTPVYVVLESHNEDSWGGVVNRPDNYLEYRQNLVDRLNLIYSYGATLDRQSDHTVLEAMIKYETDSDLFSQTDGVNILQYMEKLGDSVDPHTHLYNMADVAYLIGELGVEPSPVIGGVGVFDCGTPLVSFEDWQATMHLSADGYVYGDIYPDAVWKPEIMSGAAFRGHWFGDYTSGMWRPGNSDQFYTNQPDGQIINFGMGYPYDQLNLGETHSSGSKVSASYGSYIKELVDQIESGDAPAGKMYTAAVQIRDQITVDGEGGVDVNSGLQQFLDELKPLADAGKIKYVTYEEARQIWHDEYNEEVNQWSIENFSFYDEIFSNIMGYCSGQRAL